MTLPSRWYRDRGAMCTNINFSTPYLSLKSFEQGSAHSGQRLYKHRQQQKKKSCRVRGLRGYSAPTPNFGTWLKVSKKVLVSALQGFGLVAKIKRLGLVSWNCRKVFVSVSDQKLNVSVSQAKVSFTSLSGASGNNSSN